MNSDLVVVLEDSFKASVRGEEDIRGLAKGRVLRAYFLGREDSLKQVKDVLSGFVVFSPEELEKLKDECVLRGFEQGKTLMKANFKTWLLEGSKCLI